MSSKQTLFKINHQLASDQAKTIVEMQGRGGTFHLQGVIPNSPMGTRTDPATVGSNRCPGSLRPFSPIAFSPFLTNRP
jgi:hypothetical protein